MPKYTFKINVVALQAAYCVITVFCQVALFTCIAHPLGTCSRNKSVAGDLKRMLRRLLMCTLGCCVSSLQFNLVLVLVASHRVNLFLPNLAELDLVVTAVCVTGTFSNWRERLCPFCFVVESERNDKDRSSTK